MWALRRASIHLRNRCLSLETTRICSVKSEIGSCFCENFITESTQCQVKRRFHKTSSSSNSFLVTKLVSSLIGDKSSVDDNGVLEEFFSRRQHDDELISDLDHSEDEGVRIESVVLEGEKKSTETGAISGLTEVLLSAPANEASKVLDEWVEAGNKVSPTELSSTVLYLKSRRWYDKALQLFKWLESREEIEFTENVYAFHVDVIAKEQGSFKAEEYIQQIPESFRTEVVYTSLLKSYAVAKNVDESEKLFNKMKTLFPLTVRSCNQMLYLYSRTYRKKQIADIMEFMEKESIKPSDLTYQILISVMGRSSNISEMEQIFEKMKSDGVEPSLRNRASLARYYAASGLKDKAEAVLKDMEGGDLVKNRAACFYLLLVYASLGRDDEVGRIWRGCEYEPNLKECVAAIKAFGQLNRIEDAEAVFEKMSRILERPSSYLYAVMLDVYADHNMVTEGEDLLRRMRESGVSIHRQAWDALVKLYIGVTEVEKADAILQEATQRMKGTPSLTSFLNVLDGYAARGDVSNAEKTFSKMREAGYAMRRRPYQSLLNAYVNAKTTPPDGFDTRMMEDGMIVDGQLARLLARIAAF